MPSLFCHPILVPNGGPRHTGEGSIEAAVVTVAHDLTCAMGPPSVVENGERSCGRRGCWMTLMFTLDVFSLVATWRGVCSASGTTIIGQR